MGEGEFLFLVSMRESGSCLFCFYVFVGPQLDIDGPMETNKKKKRIPKEATARLYTRASFACVYWFCSIGQSGEET